MKINLILGVLVLLPVSLTAESVKTDTKDLLTRLHDINQEEISAGQLALRKAESKDVKKYGGHLVKDHKKADQKVLALAKEEGIDLESAGIAKKPTTLSELKVLSGAEFDRTFVNTMRTGHQDAIHLLETTEVTDAKVQKLVKNLLPELKEHEKIAQSLEPTVTTE